MSLEIVLYAKKATKNELVSLLKANGFKKSKHWLKDLNNAHNLHFYWEPPEYKSVSGVEATVSKISSTEQTHKKCGAWILHTRTTVHGVYEDKKKQNDVIRAARKKYGGSFDNDWYGTNQYTNLADYEKLSQVEIGVSFIFREINLRIEQLSHCINEYANSINCSLLRLKKDNKSLYDCMKLLDPTPAMYNSMIPFLVSLLEFFFSQLIVVLIRFDSTSKKSNELKNLIQKDRKIGSEYFHKIKGCNFQNLFSINKCYKEYLDIDVLKILNTRKKIKNRIFLIKELLGNIIDFRHKIVHELYIDDNLSKEKYLLYLEAIKISIKLVINFLKKDKKLTISELF